MIDISVVAKAGRWVLEDDEGDALGSYASRAEALAAAREYVRIADEPRLVLICDDGGEWDEDVIEPTGRH